MLYEVITDGDRLPATYANFLIINNAVLVPTYDDPADTAALADCRKRGYQVAVAVRNNFV